MAAKHNLRITGHFEREYIHGPPLWGQSYNKAKLFRLGFIDCRADTNKTNSVALSPRANYTDWSTATCRRVGQINEEISQRRMASSGILRRVALVRTEVSEELSTSFIRVTRIGEIGTTLVHLFLSFWWRRYVSPKRWFLQEPHCVTSQRTPFFIVTAVKTSNLT
jgi:hypothetical protein